MMDSEDEEDSLMITDESSSNSADDEGGGDGGSEGGSEDELIPDNDDEDVYPNWKALPYTALVHAMGFLEGKDRVNAALTCDSWNVAFSDPRLWQSRTFNLSWRTFRPTRNDSKEMQFAMKKGHCLKNMNLLINRQPHRLAKEYSKGILGFLAALKFNRCQLRRLVAEKMYLGRLWKDNLARRRIVIGFTRFFNCQSRLVHLNLSDALLTGEEAERILNALSFKTFRTLQELEFRGLLNETSNKPLNTNFFSKLPSLRYLAMDQNLMTPNILLEIITNSPYLTDLVLRCKRSALSPDPPVISSGDWTRAVGMSSRFRLDFSYEGGPLKGQLQHGMPIWRLELKEVGRQDLPAAISRIGMLFSNTLEEIDFKFEPDAGASVLSNTFLLLTYCIKLKNFKLLGTVTELTDVASFSNALDTRLSAEHRFCPIEVFSFEPHVNEAAILTSLTEFSLRYKDILVGKGAQVSIGIIHNLNII